MEPAPDQVDARSDGLERVAGRVPVTILAGFLGSGKTTLLNRILEGNHGVRVAVFVNDFGAIDIDSRLITRRDANVIALDNGCICCTIGADLLSQLTGLIEGPARPEHVLVECSGVSDPGRLLVSLRDPHFRRLSRVDGVVTLVDSSAADEIPPGALELARRQLVSADVIVLNKTDLVTRERLDDVRRRWTYPSARVLEAEHAGVPLDVVLGLDGVRAAGDDGAFGRDHAMPFATWTWVSDEPLSYDAVRHSLARLPASVFRVKGFLYLAEAPRERVVAHVVGRRVDVRPLGTWNGTSPRTELVFIGLGADVRADRARTSRLLEHAVAERIVSA
jgi:G3E family GTPase